VEKRVFLSEKSEVSCFPNLFALNAIFQLSRA